MQAELHIANLMHDIGDYCISGFGPNRTQRCLRKRTVKLRVRDTPDDVHNEFVQLLDGLNFPSPGFNRDVLEEKAARLARICMCKTCVENNRLAAVRDELLAQAGTQHRMTRATQRHPDVSSVHRKQKTVISIPRPLRPMLSPRVGALVYQRQKLPKAMDREQRTDGQWFPPERWAEQIFPMATSDPRPPRILPIN
ncbi:hypothetical protein LTR37_016878 [Vermiconidia calcicola]|uniref:Uncharacterized protein n=1 Tax=Vermiconidia calcicola TaxID=1690605 RepID=A0ACC3MPF1_9PEZI|nr:hypothetical protein LTR37_016878 [Vermiconidia calcicola]